MKIINLTRNQVALVDDEDYEWLNQWKWTAHKDHDRGYYARRAVRVPETGKQRDVYMHKVILGIDGTKVNGDHKNGKTLDNQRHNLREATHTENMRNRQINRNNISGYHGVSWNTKNNKWRVYIRVNNKKIFLGKFTDTIQAAKMYDFWARDLHGEFASCNFKGMVIARV